MKLENIKLENLKEGKRKYFKPVTGKAYRELKASIEENGILTPILIANDFEILDGWTRYLVSSELNLKEIPCEIIEEDLSKNEKEARGIEPNLRRRQLSEDSRTKATERLYDLGLKIVLEEKRNKRLEESKKEKKEVQPNLVPPGTTPQETTEKEPSDRASEREIAKKVALSKTEVHRIKEYKKAKEEEPDLVGLGVKTVIRKAKERKIPDEDKQRIKFCESLAKDIHNYVKVIEEPNVLKEIKVLLSHFTTSERLKRKIMKLIAIEKILPVDSNNPIEILIMTYKQIAGFAIKDRIWNKIHYPRHIKDAKLLLEAADDDITLAKEAIKNIGTYFQVQEISWSLKAIVKNLPAYQSNPGSFAKKTNQAMLKNISKWQGEDRKEDKAFLEKTFDEKVKEGFEISKSGENGEK